jgi:hypothetical protein
MKKVLIILMALAIVGMAGFAMYVVLTVTPPPATPVPATTPTSAAEPPASAPAVPSSQPVVEPR